MQNERTVAVRIGDKLYNMVSDDSYVEAAAPGFEPYMVKLFSSLIDRNDIVIDVGANIGCTSLLFGELASQVCSFEASPSTYRFLQRNIAQSRLKNIQLHNYALGANPGLSELSRSPTDRAGAFISDRTQPSIGAVKETIEIKRADDIFPKLGIPRVNFMKLDVEGYEKHVLEGAREIIARFKPTVVLELNHWCLNAFQRITIPDFFDYLRSIFPILLAIDGDSYADLYNESETFIVMYHHIIHFKYPNILAAFEADRIGRFHENYRRI